MVLNILQRAVPHRQSGLPARRTDPGSSALVLPSSSLLVHCCLRLTSGWAKPPSHLPKLDKKQVAPHKHTKRQQERDEPSLEATLTTNRPVIISSNFLPTTTTLPRVLASWLYKRTLPLRFPTPRTTRRKRQLGSIQFLLDQPCPSCSSARPDATRLSACPAPHKGSVTLELQKLSIKRLLEFLLLLFIPELPFLFSINYFTSIIIVGKILSSMIVMRHHSPVAYEPVSSSYSQFILVSRDGLIDLFVMLFMHRYKQFQHWFFSLFFRSILSQSESVKFNNNSPHHSLSLLWYCVPSQNGIFHCACERTWVSLLIGVGTF
ncbi:hypothetical protein VP01_2351g2 [Puccinia sorghi]|uniref:Uncharacterized protein n=1 Tax=Puccinia sorghi TaxID=27349 RepID=A0A0L6V963_9BASI|nr:hypothetical protein VP01_2351g2 [Puccinia sorghi]